MKTPKLSYAQRVKQLELENTKLKELVEYCEQDIKDKEKFIRMVKECLKDKDKIIKSFIEREDLYRDSFLKLEYYELKKSSLKNISFN